MTIKETFLQHQAMANEKMPLGVLVELLDTMKAGFRGAVRAHSPGRMPGMGPGPSISLMQEVLELRARVSVLEKFRENVDAVTSLSQLAKAQDELAAVLKEMDSAAAKPIEYVSDSKIELVR